MSPRKVVAPGGVNEQSSRDHLLHEARALSGLSHPNICTIHEVGEFNGEMYIVMELVEGRTLRELIGIGGMPVESVLRYGVQSVAALD
jgi:serine/threonine protein kinase